MPKARRRKRRARKGAGRARDEAGELQRLERERDELLGRSARFPRLAVAASAGAGPEITLGESPLDPTPLPEPTISPNAAARSAGSDGSEPGGDEAAGSEGNAQAADPAAPSIEESALTPEWLVATCEELQVTLGLVFCASNQREWDERALAACTYTSEQKARLLVFAPQALPYLAWLKDTRLVGAGLFAIGVVRAGAECIGKLRSLPMTPREVKPEPGEPHVEAGEPGDSPQPVPERPWERNRENGFFPKVL